jgi:hypothetical protein
MFSVTTGKLSNSPRQIPTIAALRSLPVAATIATVEKVTARQKYKLVQGLIKQPHFTPVEMFAQQ